jgi:hypothetical protein
MARNDKDAAFEPGSASVSPRTAEYPEITGPVSASPAKDGRDWEGPDLDAEIGKPIDPDRRQAPIVVERRGGAMRGLFWLVATLGLVVALVLGARAVGFWPSLQNPFGGKTTDRSGPALLKSVQDLNQFVAAEGNFQVIVDVQHDRKYIPDFLVNDRILFVANGSVEVYVDFSSIGQGAVKESDDRRTVEITLPAPALRPVRLDNDKSYVYQEDRGVFDRIGDALKGDPNRMQAVYKLSEQKISDAAKDAGLQKRAQDNTRAMLNQFLTALGYTSITINFPSP